MTDKVRLYELLSALDNMKASLQRAISTVEALIEEQSEGKEEDDGN